jgi:protein tyrosine phosphatase
LFFYDLRKIFSAGVGRSGTFIALDALLEMIKSQDTIDILEFTHRMRLKYFFRKKQK